MLLEEEELQRVTDFLRIISKLKITPRTGWIRCRVSGNPETIGAHSFGVALLSWIIGEERGLDTAKAVKMALAHDLLEAYTGDITPSDIDLVAKKETLEQEAISKLGHLLPENMKAEMLLLIRELRDGRSPESRIVKQSDRLDTAFQAFIYEETAYRDHPRDSVFSGFFDFAKEAHLDGYSQKLLEEIERMRRK